MKSLSKLALIMVLGFASSCAFFNDRTVELAIDSNPSGANILIEGKNYGVTPATIKIEPKAYDIFLTKEGYGSANFRTEIWWGTVRTDVAGNKTSDGTRCILDMVSLIFSFNAYNAAKCGDFKQKQYSITIPRSANSGMRSVGGVGRKPSDMINYYYNQDASNDSNQNSRQKYQQQNRYR
jgi:hypothetical protein